jgi:3-oxoacyl-[acyl-carrier protein] reductase
MNDSSGKRLLITGAAGDLGSYIGREFAKNNWIVFGLDKKAAAETLINANFVFKQCNLVRFEETAAVIDNLVETYGVFDAVINCAGLIANSPLVSFIDGQLTCHDFRLWEDVIASCLSSAFYTTACTVKHMIEANKKGVIINISSICAAGYPGQAAYSAAKAGLDGLTRALAKEIGPFGIRVIGLSPGFFDTNSTRQNVSEAKLKNIKDAIPLKRLGKPEEIVSTIRYIIQNEYINGKILELDGGLVI